MDDKEQILQNKFVTVLKQKIPMHLARTLMDILPLEKEAIYRRLRGEVSFSFVEMATISTYLGISLDNIANKISPYRSQCYQLHVRNYSDIKSIDLNMSYEYIKAINIASESPDSEFGIAANTLPLHISLLHNPLYRVYLLKWWYQSGKIPGESLVYSNVQMPEPEKKTYQDFIDAVSRVKYTFFIWDKSFFMSLINDINYFYSIRIISPEDIVMLREEMSRLLDTLEHFADSGIFETTGNRVETYISNINFDTTYSYLYSDNVHISMSNAYSLGAFTTLDKDACVDMKNWIMGLKRSSTLISGAAQHEKIMFFEKQREYLEKEFIRTEDNFRET